MRDDASSFTAAWVAACRGASDLLPEDARLVEDAYGLAFAGPIYERVARVGRAAPALTRSVLPFTGPLIQSMLWMQLRTRALDDHLRAFVAAGGAAVVLLGAGLDARAHRLNLAGVRFFEVDHPATQRRKVEVVRHVHSGAAAANVTYLPWHFERQPLSELPFALRSAGLADGQAVFTIWEGVTMYLEEPVIDASVAAIRAYSPPGSALALTYFDPENLLQKSAWNHLVKTVVARAGEPFRFGWRTGTFEPWMAARGFTVESDRTDVELSRALMSGRYAPLLGKRGGHVALVRPRG
ncbi:MAG: SAM-dependent methyltransferase [Polyangiaceae bacterium]